MQIDDDVIFRYFELLSRQSNEEIAQLKADKARGPQPDGDQGALRARARHALPRRRRRGARRGRVREHLRRRTRSPTTCPSTTVTTEGATLWIAKALSSASLVKSTSEGQRLVEQGGVEVDQERDDATRNSSSRRASATSSASARRTGASPTSWSHRERRRDRERSRSRVHDRARLLHVGLRPEADRCTTRAATGAAPSRVGVRSRAVGRRRVGGRCATARRRGDARPHSGDRAGRPRSAVRHVRGDTRRDRRPADHRPLYCKIQGHAADRGARSRRPRSGREGVRRPHDAPRRTKRRGRQSSGRARVGRGERRGAAARRLRARARRARAGQGRPRPRDRGVRARQAPTSVSGVAGRIARESRAARGRCAGTGLRAGAVRGRDRKGPRRTDAREHGGRRLGAIRRGASECRAPHRR